MLSQICGRWQQLSSVRMTAQAVNQSLENNHSYYLLYPGRLLKPTRTPSRARLHPSVQLTKHLRWFMHLFSSSYHTQEKRTRTFSLSLDVQTQHWAVALSWMSCPSSHWLGGRNRHQSSTHIHSHTSTALESPVNLVGRYLGCWGNWSQPTQTLCPPALKTPAGVQNRAALVDTFQQK